MSVIIIVGIIWGICKLISAASAASKERARQAELARVRAAQERQRAEQQRIREEWKAAQAAERERVRQMVALEREQMRLAKEQEKQRQDIVRHEEWLKKHDEEIEKLQFRLDQAESDIEFLKEKIGNLYALRDMAVNELDQAVIGGKNQTKYQKQIMSLDNQIHAAESKLNKAQFEKRTMERKMEVA